MQAYGNITKGLERIINASTPGQFTQDFLATKLDLPGGSPKPLIPFLKRTGFLGSDGAPTDLYKRFRTDRDRGISAAEALRLGYRPLFEIDESIHNAGDNRLRDVIVQHTGLEAGSSQVRATQGSFKALLAFADFEAADTAKDSSGDGGADEELEDGVGGDDTPPEGLRLAYNINLHLPATSDIAVFNAIFKSLREHLVK